MKKGGGVVRSTVTPPPFLEGLVLRAGCAQRSLKGTVLVKMVKHGLWCSRQGWGFAPLVVSTAGVPHADSLRFLELLSS